MTTPSLRIAPSGPRAKQIFAQFSFSGAIAADNGKAALTEQASVGGIELDANVITLPEGGLYEVTVTGTFGATASAPGVTYYIASKNDGDVFQNSEVTAPYDTVPFSAAFAQTFLLPGGTEFYVANVSAPSETMSASSGRIFIKRFA